MQIFIIFIVGNSNEHLVGSGPVADPVKQRPGYQCARTGRRAFSLLIACGVTQPLYDKRLGLVMDSEKRTSGRAMSWPRRNRPAMEQCSRSHRIHLPPDFKTDYKHYE